MCTPDAPPPPDYRGAAKEQGDANKEAAIASSQLSNPNVSNPYGDQTVTYTIDPTTGNPVPHVKQTFSPTQQGIFDTTQQAQQATADLSLTGANNAKGILGQSFDINSIPGIDKTAIDRNSVRDALVARATEANTIDRDKVRSNLVAQGIPVGSEAYNREMAQLDRSMVDARQQAEIGAGQAEQQAMAARQQMIQEALLQRQTPLNEIASLRSGSQLNPLQFSNVSGATAAPAPIFGATQAQGTRDLGQYQSDLDYVLGQKKLAVGGISKAFMGSGG
jgi:hypothetical protein